MSKKTQHETDFNSVCATMVHLLSHCLDVTTEPNEPDKLLLKEVKFLSFLREIQISIDHSLSYYHLQSFYINKKGKIRGFFSKFTRNPEQKKYLSYKYFDFNLLIIKNPGLI